MNANWRADCPKCVASKFACDEHYSGMTQGDRELIERAKWYRETNLGTSAPVGYELMGNLIDRLQALSAEVERLREALAEIRDLPGEINPSNYDHDDACYLNTQFVDAINIAAQALKGANNG